MSNIVKFKINGLSSALSSVYTRVTDLSRVELFEGETLVSDAVGNVELDIGAAGSVGQGVIVYGDNYSTGNESTFKSFSGYSVVEVPPSSAAYDNIVFFGSSTTERAFATQLERDDMSILLADYGISGVDLYTNAVGGTDAVYQNNTLMPQAIAEHNSLSNVMLFMQSPTNSLTTAYSSATTQYKDALSTNINGIMNQAISQGWDVFCSNFNTTAGNIGKEPSLWDANILKPIVEASAPISLDNGNYIQDYNALSSLSNYILAASDNTHLKEIAGDRAYAQLSALSIADNFGKKPVINLAGRRVVASVGGTTPAEWVKYNGINKLQSSVTATTSERGVACSLQLFDADTGELIPGLIFAIRGAIQTAAGRGNAGNTSTSVYNNDALITSLYTKNGSLESLRFVITTVDGTVLPNATITIAASRNSTSTQLVTDWTCGGETKALDAGTVPCGVVTFNNVAPINNEINGTSAIAAGSAHSFFSAIEIQFS